MSSLLVRPQAPDSSGCILEVTPESAGWKHVGFRLLALRAGQQVSASDAGRETCIVVLTGTALVTVGGEIFGAIGGRASVFDDVAPGAVYIPAGLTYAIDAVAAAQVAVCTAPGREGAGHARVIGSHDMPREVRGKDTNTRYIRNILPETQPADSLLVVEVITPSAHWSSYPPHKHDTALANETALEETYYYRVAPAQGFGFQRVYTDDGSLDETMCVHDGDLVMVPRGYHPVGAAHGYDLYYLNVMAGAERKWVARNDPAHDWIVRKR
jgi:5-deoxy-glucuronate isomerase